MLCNDFSGIIKLRIPMDTNTFAWRVMIARKERGLNQRQVVDLLCERYSIDLTPAAYSKIERGETELPRIKVLIAISDILGVSLHKLLTGQDWTEPVDQFSSPEANIVGSMVDGMMQDSRETMVYIAKRLLDKDNLLRDRENTLLAIAEHDVSRAEGNRSIGTSSNADGLR